MMKSSVEDYILHEVDMELKFSFNYCKNVKLETILLANANKARRIIVTCQNENARKRKKSYG